MLPAAGRSSRQETGPVDLYAEASAAAWPTSAQEDAAQGNNSSAPAGSAPHIVATGSTVQPGSTLQGTTASGPIQPVSRPVRPSGACTPPCQVQQQVPAPTLASRYECTTQPVRQATLPGVCTAPRPDASSLQSMKAPGSSTHDGGIGNAALLTRPGEGQEAAPVPRLYSNRQASAPSR